MRRRRVSLIQIPLRPESACRIARNRRTTEPLGTEARDTSQLRRRPDTLDGPYARSARGVGKQAGDT